MKRCRSPVRLVSALEAAHEKGIIHRDLKPSNVKINTPEGITKVLDFRRAKSSAATEIDSLPSPTMPAITRDGELVGTAAFSWFSSKA